MYDPSLKRQLYLTQDWEAAWHHVVKPWLANSGRVNIGTVVVPTRGQARALRSRMANEGIATVGIRFVTPGLIRTMVIGEPMTGREFPDRAVLEFGLKQALSSLSLRSGRLAEEEGLTMSLLSRPGAPIGDWEDLVRAGLDERSFPHPFLRKVFKRLRSWLKRNGFRVPFEDSLRSDGNGMRDGIAGQRILFYGFSAEDRSEWPHLSSYCHEGDQVVSVVPYPSFAGKPLEEQWVDLWETILGCEAVSLPDQEERENGALARNWALGSTEQDESLAHDRARLLVGRNPAAEMALVFNQIVDWLGEGPGQIAVVFPTVSPAVADLSRRLTEARIRFCDEISTTGAPSQEVGLTRTLLTYQRSGCELEDLWQLARLLRGAGLFGLTAGESRDWIERVFDAAQSHRVAEVTKLPEAGRLRGGEEMSRLISEIGFWPEKLTIAAAIDQLTRDVEAWGIELPIRNGGLELLRRGDDRDYERESVIDLILASLPERAPRQGHTKDDFAPVVLTTRKRAESLGWAHILFAGTNAESWPPPPEETFWLPDAARRILNRNLKGSVQLPLTEDASLLERLACLGLCGNVVGTIAFSACLQADNGGEVELTPHPWMERILLRRARSQADSGDASDRAAIGFREEWHVLAQSLPNPPAPSVGLEEWGAVWKRRRDAEEPFDFFFYCAEPGGLADHRWAARLLERGFSDPVVLWYEGVLRVRPVDEHRLERSRQKELGLLAHRLLAQALRGDRSSGRIFPAPSGDTGRARLGRLLDSWRNRRPRDAYWDSFYLELASITHGLFESLADKIEGTFLAIEYPLPGDTVLSTAHGDLAVAGRLDLAILDQPDWDGALARVIDFKTGRDQSLDAARMGRMGQSLQLGVYLQSALALGARSASVEMIRAGQEPGPTITSDELFLIQPAFDFLGAMVQTGKFGQLTADRTRFQSVFETPLACVPIPATVLKRKFQETFPGFSGAADQKRGQG